MGQNRIEIGFWVSIQLVIISILLFFLEKYNFFYVNKYLSLNFLFLISFFLFTLFFLKKYENIIEVKIYSPIFLLLILFIYSVNNFLQIGFLTNYNYILILLTLVLGFISFYTNKDIFEKIELESKLDFAKETKREKEFEIKFYRISKFPGINKIFKWIYKEGYFYSLILFLIALLIIFLSVSQWSLIKSFWIDEWISIKTSQIFSSQNFPYFESGNPMSSGYIYFFLVYLINLLFKGYIHSGRILNLIFIILFIPLYYIFVKKYFKNKTIAILSLFILSISFFTIYMVNEVRGYVFSLLLIYLCIFLFFSNLNNIFRFFSILLLLVILLDNHLTNSYFIFVFLIIVFIDLLIDERKRKYLFLFFIISIFLGVLILLAYKGSIYDAILFYFDKLIGSSLPGWAAYRENLFFPFIYLYENIGNFLLVLIGLIGYISFFYKKKEYVYLSLFVLIFLLPICFSGVPNGFRYFFTIIPFFTLILSIGIYYFIFLYNNKLKLILCVLLILFSLIFVFSNINNQVPWAKTLDFNIGSQHIKELTDNSSLVITNYMGVQFSDEVEINYILYDNQSFYYYENQGKFGKQNIFGYEFEGEVGKHFLLNLSYINLTQLENLSRTTNSSTLIVIRPWSVDITSDTINKLTDMGFRDVSPENQYFKYYLYSH